MTLLKNAKVYLFSNIINAGMPFFLLPILTKILTPAEYGQIAMFQILVMGLSAFVGLNTIDASKRKLFDPKLDKSDIEGYNSACFYVLAVSTIIIFSIFLFSSDLIAYYLTIPVTWVYLAVVYSFCNYILTFRLAQWQMQGFPFSFAKLSISSSTINVVITLVFVIIIELAAEGRVWAQLIAIIISAAYALYSLIKDDLILLRKINPNYVRESLMFGVPLIPHVLGYFLLTSVDRFVINQSLGLTQAGIYMVAIQLSMGFNIVFDALNKAFVPWLYSVLKNNLDIEKNKVVKYTYVYFVFLILISSVPFVIGSNSVKFIAGANYIINDNVIGLICLGQIFGGMYRMVTNYLFYAKKTGVLSFVTLISGIINIVLLLILVPEYGFLGAALAFSTSKLIQFLMTWMIAYMAIDMPWFSFKILTDN